MRTRHSAMAAVACGVLTLEATAQLVSVGPFTGALQEDYERFVPGGQTSPMSIFGGAATFTSTSLFIYGPGQTFGIGGNGTAQPFSGDNGWGLNSSTTTATIDFRTPVTAFGGYWSHSTFGVNQFELTFRDAGGALIGMGTGTVADPTGNLHWFGWTSNTPIASVEIGGRFTVHDFLQATPIPAPAAFLVILAAGAAARRRR